MEDAHMHTPTDRLASALAALLDWARENTSPNDLNSPHELLIEAAEALDELEYVRRHERLHALLQPRKTTA